MMKNRFKILIFALVGLVLTSALSNAWALDTKAIMDSQYFKDNVMKIASKSEVGAKKDEAKAELKKIQDEYSVSYKEIDAKVTALKKRVADKGGKVVVTGGKQFVSLEGQVTNIDPNLWEAGFVVTADKEKQDEELNTIQKQLNAAQQEAYALYTNMNAKRTGILNKIAALGSGGDIYQYTDPKTGNITYFEMDGNTMKATSGVTKGCAPLPAKLAEAQSCLFCPLFTVIFETAQQMATEAYKVLSGPMAQLVLLAFAIWVALKVLGQVSSFTKQDGPKFITELLIQAFKVLLTVCLLMWSSNIYGYVIGPLLRAGLEFGTALLFDIQPGGVDSTCGNMEGVTQEFGVLPIYLHEKILCFIKETQREIAVAQAVSTTLMCVAIHEAKSGLITITINVISWDWSMLIQGFAIFVFSWAIMLAFSFYLIDATVRLGIVGTLMPFLIACWPFNATRKYTNTGWTMFMNTFFTYVFVGLVVMVNIKLMGQALSGGKGGFDAIVDALNGDSVDELQKLLDIGFAGFLMLIACCIFGFKLSTQASELAGSMAGGGGGTPIGSKIGGLGTSVATTVGKGLWSPAKKLGGMAWDSKAATNARAKVGRGLRMAWTDPEQAGEKIGFAAASAVNKVNNFRKKIGALGQEGLDFNNQINGRGHTGEGNTNPSNNDGTPPNGPTPSNNPENPPINPNAEVNSGGNVPNNTGNNAGGGSPDLGAMEATIRAEIAKAKAEIAALSGTTANPVKLNAKGIERLNNAKGRLGGLEKQLQKVEETKTTIKPQETSDGEQSAATSTQSMAQPTAAPATPAQGAEGQPQPAPAEPVAPAAEAPVDQNMPSGDGASAGKGVRRANSYKDKYNSLKRKWSSLKKKHEDAETQLFSLKDRTANAESSVSTANIQAKEATKEAANATNKITAATDASKVEPTSKTPEAKAEVERVVEIRPGETIVIKEPASSGQGGGGASSGGGGSSSTDNSKSSDNKSDKK